MVDSNKVESTTSFCEALSRDISAFAQKACSSPRIVFDVGERKDLTSIAKTMSKLAKSDKFSVGRGINHLVTEQLLASAGHLESTINLDGFQILRLKNFSIHSIEWHSGESQLYWIHISSLLQLTEFIDEKCQTIGYFGVEKQELLKTIDQMPISSIDRVVPIGKALDFDIVWDGYDLFSQLSRKVSVI